MSRGAWDPWLVTVERYGGHARCPRRRWCQPCRHARRTLTLQWSRRQTGISQTRRRWACCYASRRSAGSSLCSAQAKAQGLASGATRRQTRSNLNDSAVWDPDALSGIAASRFGTAARNLKQGQADKARTATASRPVSHADVCTELRGLVPAGLLYVWVGVRSVGLRACICRETRNGDARLHRGGLLRGMDGGEEGQHHNVLAAVWTGMARSEHADQPSTAASLGGLRRRSP